MAYILDFVKTPAPPSKCIAAWQDYILSDVFKL